MWLALSLVNMLGQAALRLTQKSYVVRTSANAYHINWLMQAVSLPVLLALIVWKIHYISSLPMIFWVTLFAVVIGFYPIVSYLMVKVLRNNDVSDVLPLMGFMPIVSALFGWLILKQRPSLLAAIGIGFISLSIYTIQMRADDKLKEPLRKLATTSTGKAMMIISVITGLAAIGDKVAINHSSPISYLALNMTGAFLLLALCDVILLKRSTNPTLPPKDNNHKNIIWLLILMGLLNLTTMWLSFDSLSLSPNAGYAVAVRNLNIIVASIVAIVLFKERLNKYKIISYLLSAVGLILIAL